VASDGPSAFEQIINLRERDRAVQALLAGVVPRIGIPHIQVGRVNEFKQVLRDFDRVADQGSAVRFIVGDYGSGKTFFLSLARSIAIQSKLVAVHADLSLERRTHATGGDARNLYAELMRNMATRTKPEGTVASVVERFIGIAQTEAKASGRRIGDVIHERLAPIHELVSGYDFANVVDHPRRRSGACSDRRRSRRSRGPSSALRNTNVEVRNAGGLTAPSDNVGSEP
jgi:hypothetical protein